MWPTIFVAVALWSVCVIVFVDHLRQPRSIENEDLGAVDPRETVRRSEWDSRPPNLDLVTRRERMRDHPQRIMWR